MKTRDDIRNEFIKKVTEYSQKKEDERSLYPDGTKKDKSMSVNVTDICAWSTYCPKQVYYNKTAKRPVLPEALMRFQVGHSVHEFPVWDDGNEQSFEWEGMRCRMDDIHFKDGIIIDKKTVSSLPRAVKPYVEKQLNIYKIIAEENKERPIKINQLFVINVAVVNGEIQVLDVPIWDRDTTLNFINTIRQEINYHVSNKYVPDILYKSKGWICDNCQYQDICMKDIPGGNPTMEKDYLEDSATDTGGIKIRVNKK
jgi:CRISPR/Cas system-associated exonuclease Cas4 (RecB family)